MRLPLPLLTVVAADPAALQPFSSIIADEVNVRSVRLVGLDDPEAHEVGITQRLTVNARAAGPRLGKAVQDVIRASKSGDWQQADDGTLVCGGVTLADGEFTLETVVSQGDSSADGTPAAAVAVLGGGFVVLDTTVTAEAAREGLARDLVRAVQQARRDAGLAVGDRIVLTLTTPSAEVPDAVTAHEELIRTETLAVEVVVEPEAEARAGVSYDELAGSSLVQITVSPT